MTAKIVIASANRLIDMRHFCRNSSRIAEISVPAWPMPIHQTKLTMAKPQPTGTLTPQMPVPFISSQVTANRNINITRNAMTNPTSHPGRNPRRSTTDAIALVTEPKECPGPTSSMCVRATPAVGAACAAMAG